MQFCCIELCLYRIVQVFICHYSPMILDPENTMRHLLFSIIFRYSNSLGILVRCEAHQVLTFSVYFDFFAIVYGPRTSNLFYLFIVLHSLALSYMCKVCSYSSFRTSARTWKLRVGANFLHVHVL